MVTPPMSYLSKRVSKKAKNVRDTGNIRTSLPRVRASRTHSYRQRSALCHYHARPPVLPVGLWVRLEILPEFIEPGKPQQNGRHEHMHRIPKPKPPAHRRATAPPRRRFNNLPRRINHERPHEALEMMAPASRYEASPRLLPAKVPPLD